MVSPPTPTTAPTARSCPICGKPTAHRWRPFCSKRCADVDLGRWFGEVYRVPEAVGADDAEQVAAPDEHDDDTQSLPPTRS